MFEEKFGGVLGNKIKFDGESIFVDNTEIKLQRIKSIHYSKPTFFSSGYVYFSRSGRSPENEREINFSGFKYSKKQVDSAHDLLGILSEIEDLEVIEEAQGLGSIRMNDIDKQNQATKKRKEEKQRLKCPKCKGTNLQHLGNKKKGFSVGKAVGGAVLTGGVGTLAGFAGKKGKKENWVCMNCGKKFSK